MKKLLYSFIFAGLVVFLFGCSLNGEKSSNGDDAAPADYDYAEGAAEEQSEKGNSNNANGAVPDSERMVMYNARLVLAVTDVTEVIGTIESKTTEFSGYVVQSSTFEQEKKISGRVSVRIPSERLSTFLDDMSELSDKVIQKTIEGQDVTEEYVDLESRLRAKKALESRLLDLLNGAKTTEDLLKISDDLATVQEEIEQIEGRKRYLENRTDFAQVDIEIEDASVYIPEVTKGEDLQTGSKIKQAFTNSINLIVGLFSGLIVFLVGYSPILLLLAVPAVIIWFVLRKRKDSNSHGAEQ